MPSVTVIIPTLNEERNIQWVIEQVLATVPAASVIVADDGSSDRTQEVVVSFSKERRGIRLLDRSLKTKGLTASVVDAIMHATTDLFVVIDGDGQHPPEKIAEMISLMTAGTDLVVGVREKVANEWPLPRRLMSAGACFLAQCRLRATGTPTADPVSGFFGGRTAVVQEVLHRHPRAVVSEGYKVLFDVLKLRRWSVREVPYVFGVRRGGSSKIGGEHVWAFVKSLVR